MANHLAAPARRIKLPSRSGRGGVTRLAVAGAAAALAASLTLVVPVAAPSTARTAAAAIATGFVDETIVTGLTNPTSVVYAPDGRVFVAEKRGIVKTWATVAAFEANGPATQTVDIRPDVMNYWDRGLLGLAVDPAYPATPAIYVLYTYDALPGGSPPRWNAGDPDGDPCPAPPGGNTDGCVVTNRLERITVNPATGVWANRTPLLTGWCQQFASHSAGSVVFGPDGMLYLSAGEGASFNAGAQDYGQLGGTLPNTTSPVTPINPCGDPPGPVGGPMTAPTGEGGALRAQSFRRPAGEAAVLNGAILRLDPATGLAAAGNPAAANSDPIRRRIVAYGLRNPYRMTFRPGTSELFIGDVGYSTWEEIDRLVDPLAATLTNFGWPCAEGPEWATYFTTVTPNLCASLTPQSVTNPLYAYAQGGHLASGDGCPPTAPATHFSAAVSGLAFATATDYPSEYRNGLFFADYARNCIAVLPDRGDGVPSDTAVPFSSSAASPVMLTTDPDGHITYVDFNGGTIHRIRYNAPVASFTATPSSGPAPLNVTFNGTASTSPVGIVAWDWDFGDGSPHGSGSTTTHQYQTGTWTARLTVTDTNGDTATRTKTIASDNTPPVVTIDQPSCTVACWSVGDTINLAAHGSDDQDGTLPGTAFDWQVKLVHCHSVNDCHDHDLASPSGVASTSLVAPDHDAGTFLRILVTATDSGGLTTTESIEVAPQTSPLTVTSSPSGLPVTLDGETANGTVGPLDEIVGHSATVGAAASYTTGEDRWTFSSWSDGGPIVHTVTVGATPRTLTATYTKTSLDAANTCAGAALQTPSNSWSTAGFGTTNDVDWVKFKVTKTGWYRVVLGHLPVNATLSLYRDCSTLLKTSSSAGLHWEEIISSLAPGTYAIKMATVGGASATSHRYRIQALSGTVPLLGVTTVPTTSLRLVGEVYNTSTAPRSVTVTVKLYSASGTLLKTVAVHPLLPVLAGRARSPFVIATSKPAALSYVRYTITSSAASRATRVLAATGLTGTAPVPGDWKVTGSVVNSGSTTATNVTAIVYLYDDAGTVFNATTTLPASRTLKPGQHSSFSTTFRPVPVAPLVSAARGRAS